MLEHVTLPDSISYFLQGRQWIDASSGSDAEWLRKLETSAAQIATQPVTIPPPSTALRRIDLPAPPGDLIGRNREVEDIVDRYRDGARLITLTGPGGIGKTRVALEAARGVAEVVATDVLFIDLAPVDESDLVPSAIARSLGVRESGDRSTGESIRVATLSPAPDAPGQLRTSDRCCATCR